MLKYIFLFTNILYPVLCKNYFCNFPCKDLHTVCRREPCSVSKACGKGAKALSLNDQDRQWILDLHNNYRNKIALGELTIGGNGPASNMNVLNYDKELEYVAQCWSNACEETGSSHDVCRSTRKFEYVGQNMYSIGSSVKTNFRDKKYLTKAVQAWFFEISSVIPSEIDSFQGTSGIIGHFTQVVWAETTHIGCGRTYYIGKNGFHSVYIYCNYGQGGNVLDTPVYRRGRACSECTGISCISKYTGLCGDAKEIDLDKWIPKFEFGSGSKICLCLRIIVNLTIILLLM